MAAPLQDAKHHDLHKRANMKAVSGAIKTDIGRDRMIGRQRVKSVNIGGLMNIATLAKLLD
jgi:hypothetical protein